MNSLTAEQENGGHHETEPEGVHNFAQHDSDTNTINRSPASDSGLRREEYKKEGSWEDITVNKPAKRKTPRLARLRRSFEHHVKLKDDSSKRSQKRLTKHLNIKFKNDRVIQRSKSYHGPFRKKKSHKEKLSRRKSYGGREPSSRFQEHVDSGDGQTGKETDQAALKMFHYTENKPKVVSNKNKAPKDVANNKVHKWEELKEKESCVSLYHIIQHSQLIAVKLQRTPEESWGIELLQVDKEDSSTSENGAKLNKGITVDRAKKPAIHPTAVQRETRSTSHHINLVAELGEAFRRSIKKKNDGIKASLSSSVKEQNYQPRHGVRILGLTEKGVAARDGKLAVKDLIIEVRFVLVHDLLNFVATRDFSGPLGFSWPFWKPRRPWGRG